jgi:hypothetical protein
MALSDSLVSYWELEETSGTRVDSHGSNDLTDNNTVGSAAGIQGNGADFERDNSEYLSITDAAQTGLEYNADFTINFWMYAETLETLRTPFSKWQDTTGNGILAFLYTNGDLRTYIASTASTNVNKLFTSTGITAGAWFMVTVTFDVSAGSMQLYVNATSKGTQTGFSTSPYQNSEPFRIGAYNSSAGQPFDGIIDEFGFWSRVLTSTEVTELYNSGDGLSYADVSGGGAAAFVPRVSFII